MAEFEREIIGTWMAGICQCGCGQPIPIKKHHKYYGAPKYLKGHNTRGEGIRNLNNKRGSDRPKNYQDPEWLLRTIKERWCTIEEIASDEHVTAQTIRKYMRESGFTLNSIAGEIAREHEDDHDLIVVMMPGVNPKIRKQRKLKAKVFETRRYSHDGSYIPISQKIFVKGYGLGYLSKPVPSIFKEVTIEITALRRFFKIDTVTPTKIELPENIDENISIDEMIENIHKIYGDVEVLTPDVQENEQ